MDTIHCALQAQPPKLELELPYRMYRLVAADGTALERPEKHPFCMSRVFYNGVDRPGPEAWAELADGSCRWRQTGSEVKVVALKVRAGLLLNTCDLTEPVRELRASLGALGLTPARCIHKEDNMAPLTECDAAGGLIVPMLSWEQIMHFSHTLPFED